MPAFQIPGLGQAKPNETLPPLSSETMPESFKAVSPAPEQTPQPAPPNTEDQPMAEAGEEQGTLQPEKSLPQDQEDPDAEKMNIDAPEDSPSLTCLLEASIGGLGEDADILPAATPDTPQPQSSQRGPHDPTVDATVKEEPKSSQGNPQTAQDGPNPDQDEPQLPENQAKDGLHPNQGEPQPLADQAQDGPHPGQDERQPLEDQAQPDENENPEWEVDSSPYESSSDSSTDTSSEADGYELLGVQETARLLLEMEDDVDEAGDHGDRPGSNTAPRTKNEQTDEADAVPKPDITLTADEKIEKIGAVEHIVDKTLVIKADTGGEYQVLDSGSILCTSDRNVIGVVAETIGKVLQPRYTMRFNSLDELTALGLEAGTDVYYPVERASFVFTEKLKPFKGSDASNIHDEEVGADEMDFSDDEKEAMYRRSLKAKKKKPNKVNDGTGIGAGRGPHPLSQEISAPARNGLEYDDGPYKPLRRPADFGTSTASTSDPAAGQLPSLPVPPRRGGGGGGGNGWRGDRRGRGAGRGQSSNRGGGRGGHGSPQEGYSLPPRGYVSHQAPPLPYQMPNNFAMPFPAPTAQVHAQAQAQAQAQENAPPSSITPAASNSATSTSMSTGNGTGMPPVTGPSLPGLPTWAPQQQQSAVQTNYMWQLFLQQQQQQQQQQQYTQSPAPPPPSWPASSSPTQSHQLPQGVSNSSSGSGTHMDPALIAAFLSHMQGQNGQQQQQQQQHQQ